jgi:hypothetical protein
LQILHIVVIQGLLGFGVYVEYSGHIYDESWDMLRWKHTSPLDSATYPLKSKFLSKDVRRAVKALHVVCRGAT